MAMLFIGLVSTIVNSMSSGITSSIVIVLLVSFTLLYLFKTEGSKRIQRLQPKEVKA
jgi:Flp pilus assembly protein TadB